MAKLVKLEVRFIPRELNPKRTTNVVLEKLAELNAKEIHDWKTGNGPSRSYHASGEFRTRRQAIQAASRIHLSINGIHSNDWPDFTINGKAFELFDFEDTECGDDASVIEINNFAWELYREKGGKMGRMYFLLEALGRAGGIDRVYVEEGLEAGLSGGNEACLRY